MGRKIVTSFVLFLCLITAAWATPQGEQLRASWDEGEDHLFASEENPLGHCRFANFLYDDPSSCVPIRPTPHSLTVQLSRMMNRLENVLQQGGDKLAFDESLRNAVWELSNTIDFSDSKMVMSPDSEKNKIDLVGFREKRSFAIEMVKLGYETYQRQQRQIDQILSTESRYPAAYDALDIATGGKIPDYAAQFEDECGGSASWNKESHACGGTARAIFYYFRHKYSAGSKRGEVHLPDISMDEMIKQIEQRHRAGDAYLYMLTVSRLDHVFVIQQTSDGYYRILQSYVGWYSLRAAMAQQNLLSGGVPYMNYEQLLVFLRNFKALVEMESPTDELLNLHEQMFYVPLSEELIEGLSFESRTVDLHIMPIPGPSICAY